jgi:hypothetical protein
MEGATAVRHKHSVTERDFTVEYEHDDTPPWHTSNSNEGHDHALVVVLGGEVTAENPGDLYNHANSGDSTIV